MIIRQFYTDGTWGPPVDTLFVELIATDEVIETPAGIFEAHVYRYYLPPADDDVLFGDDIYDYFVPGVGQVAQIWKTPNSDEEKMRYELVDYCLFDR